MDASYVSRARFRNFTWCRAQDEHGTSNGRVSAAGWLVGDRAWQTSTLAPWVAMHGSCAGGTNRCLTLAYCYT